MSPSLRTQLVIGLLAATLILGLTSWYAHRNASRLITSAESVSHNHQVLTQLHSLLANLEYVESEQRAYLLTGQEVHANAYRRADREALADFERLHALVAEDPVAAAQVAGLRPLLLQRLSLLSSVFDVYEEEGLGAAQAQIQAGRGSAVMDEIRMRMNDLESRERALLAQRLAVMDATSLATPRTLDFGTLVVFLILLLGAVIIGRDVKRRQQAEEELRKAKEAAESSNRAKMQFLATVSHEVRTPLNAIIGMTEFLRSSAVNSEQAELSRMVHTNAESLLHLINDLLDSSKIEAQQVDLEQVPLSVREVVEGVAEILAVRAEAKDLELAVWIDPDLPVRVLGDPSRLGQILMNLVGNAIKFTEQGEVVVRALATPAEPTPDRVAVTFEVVDTGVGVSPEDRERIFGRFEQAEASTTRRFGGTGLGLSIAKALVELMGGRLELESAAGAGSTFRVFLTFEIDPAPPQRFAYDGALRGLNVLVVTPNGTNRNALAEMLRAAGATIDTAPKTADVLIEDDAGRWHVIVCEAPITKMEGLELAEAARRQSEEGAGIVCLSGLNGSFSENRLRLADRVEYVLKPVKQARLIEAVLAASGRSLPQSVPTQSVRMQPHHVAPRVLVVDDNRDNWHLTSRVLSTAGYEVDLADDGAAAVDRVRRFRYDLVLMDIDMPVMDGFTATREIRAIERAEGREPLPIIALTAHAVEGFRQQSLESGMDDFATKPIRSQQLLEKVGAWVDHRPVILVADDAPESAVVVRKYLEGEPVRLVFARDGKEALAAFQRNRVALVLLDMDMPVLDGYATARAIRRMWEGRTVPIIAMTGYVGADERRKCMEAGCTTHLPKPLRRAALVRTVHEMLQQGEPEAKALPTARPSQLVAPVEPAQSVRQGAPKTIGDLHRIRRLLDQGRFADAADYAGLVHDEFLRAGTPELIRMAREVVAATRSEDKTSAKLWADRLAEALYETDRLATLRTAHLLDAPPEESFDHLTRLASRALKAPVALVSLIDKDRQFFFSQCGLPEPWAEQRETPLSHSFCQHVVAASEPLIVENARVHPLVNRNLAIEDIGVVAYLGFPIVHEGFTLGSFCVIDTEARVWTPEEVAMVEDFAALVAREIDLRMKGDASQDRGVHAAPSQASDVMELEPEDEVERDFAAPPSFVEAFLKTRRDDVRQAREHLHQGAFDDIARLGHQLKGSSATLGFPEIGKIGAELEQAARQSNRARVQAALNLLEDSLGGSVASGKA